MQLTDRIDTIKGIGDKTRSLFEKLGVYTVGSLLSFYPNRYDRFSDPSFIANVKEDEINTIMASVSFVKSPANTRMKITTCKAKDETGEVELVWFNQPYIAKELKSGYHFIFRGKVVRKGLSLVMEQPKIYRREEYRVLQESLQPVYSLVAGLTNNAVRKAMNQALVLAYDLPDFIPVNIRKQYDLMNKKQALMEVHFPKSEDNMLRARYSLVFEEFFLFVIYLKAMSAGREVLRSELVFKDNEACQQLIDALPFKLTEDQLKVFEQIKKDMLSDRVMARLVQGDVGSGKTIVSELALLLCAKSGYQGAIMVPTEVLARQHYETMGEALKNYGVNVGLLVGSMTAKEKREVYTKTENHEIDVLVGTHTLFQEKLQFDALGLCVTDEQHRFGVKQREGLSKKGKNPHILVMSATPIPRTLAMMMYADMDISKIKTMPSNRLPIKNCVVGREYRNTAYKFMAKQIEEGRQCYIICPQVDESEADGVNVTDYSTEIKQYFAPSVNIEMLHGKMKPKDKNDVMERFAKGEIDILVSTTVVEVGVSVSNATVMMIEDADKFGLAQLHQLRGRVGRGSHQSFCIFVNGKKSDESNERLKVLENSNDGFFIANEDLRLRGPGNLFGIRQSGDMVFKIGDIYQDADVMTEAYDAVQLVSEKQMSTIVEKLNDSGGKEVFLFLEKYDTI